jgi:hypothetical protein
VSGTVSGAAGTQQIAAVFKLPDGRIVAYRSYLRRLAELAGTRSRVILFGRTPGRRPHALRSRLPRDRARGRRIDAGFDSGCATGPGRSGRGERLGVRHCDQMGNSPEECMRKYVHTRSEDARYRMRRAVAEAARQAS